MNRRRARQREHEGGEGQLRLRFGHLAKITKCPTLSRAAAEFTASSRSWPRCAGPTAVPWDREQTIDSLKPFVLEETYEVLEAIDAPRSRGAVRGARRLRVRGGVSRAARGRGRATSRSPTRSRASPTSWCGATRTSSRATTANRRSTPPARCGRAGRRSRRRSAAAQRDGRRRCSAASRRRCRRCSARTTSAPAPRRSASTGARRATSSRRSRRRSTSCARSSTRPAPIDQARAEEEMGDLLFSIANLSRQLGIEPETALRKANDKFTKRFGRLEQSVADSGTSDEGDDARGAGGGVAAAQDRQHTE